MRPTLTEIGGFSIPAYGATLTLIFVVGLLLLRRKVRSLGVGDQAMLDLAAIAAAVIVGWLGLGLLVNRTGLAGAPHFNALPMLSVGAFAYLGYLRHKGLPAERVFDAIAPIAALALALQYGVGTLLAGTAFGKPTAVPWAISFPPGSPAWRAYGDAALHPVQAYLALGLIMIAAAARFWPLPTPPGERALATFIAIAILYLATSPLRGNTTSIFAGQIPRMSEIVALLIVGYCSFMLWRLRGAERGR